MNGHTPPQTADDTRGLLKIGEAATRLRCSPKSIRRLVKAGHLPCVRYTASRTEPLKFRAVDVARLIERSVTHPAAPNGVGGISQHRS